MHCFYVSLMALGLTSVNKCRKCFCFHINFKSAGHEKADCNLKPQNWKYNLKYNIVHCIPNMLSLLYSFAEDENIAPVTMMYLDFLFWWWGFYDKNKYIKKSYLIWFEISFFQMIIVLNIIFCFENIFS